MSISDFNPEDDVPLSVLASPCHQNLDPKDFIALLPKPEPKSRPLMPGMTSEEQELAHMATEDYLDELLKVDKKRKHRAEYMKLYRAQHS